jgi:hypothetical protein
MEIFRVEKIMANKVRKNGCNGNAPANNRNNVLMVFENRILLMKIPGGLTRG